MQSQTRNSIALITGGCSGIGLAIGYELASRGYDLVLVSNRDTEIREACESIATMYGRKTWPVCINLGEPDAATKLYDWCRKEALEIEILVNNAGIFFFKEVVETNTDIASLMLQLHTTTPALLSKLFGKDMKLRRSGHIMYISSLAAYMPYPGIALYSATKSFLKTFSRALRSEMREYGVNVTCVFPGAVSTQLYALSEADHKKALRSGIMMRADKLAKKAVSAMLKRKGRLVPGIFNRISLWMLLMTPHGLIILIRKYSRLLPPDKN